MSLNPLNNKKTKRLSKDVGIEFDRVLVFADGITAYARTSEDKHYVVNRYTKEVKLQEPQIHFTSCHDN